MANKRCRECKWFVDTIGYPVCRNPYGGQHPIDSVAKPKYCDMQRGDGWVCARLFKTCGAEGRFWEQKE